MSKRSGLWLLLVVLAGLSLSGCAGQRPDPAGASEAGAGDADAARVRAILGEERWNKIRTPKIPNRWFMQQRMSGDPVPAGAISRAVQRRRVEAATDGGTDEAPGVWQSVGPENVGGRVTALAVDPNDSNRIWLGAAAGGVWLSEDGGSTWTPKFDHQLAHPVGSLAAHPTDSNIVYVGGGEDNGGGYSYDGEGVLKTTDGGQTWVNMGLQETRRIGGIAIDPVDPQRVFVAGGGNVFLEDEHRGVYRSTDGGQTWQKVLFVANDTGAHEVHIDPGNSNRVFATMWTRQSSDVNVTFGGPSCGIWRSEDGGDTWTRLTSGLPDTNLGLIGLAISESNPNIVYARYQNTSGSYKGLWRSNDSGDTWFKADTGGGLWRFFLVSYGYYFGEVRVDPANPEHVFMLDSNWFESSNGGESFQNRGGMHVDHHDMVIEPGRWLMGNDGGFYWSTNNGGSWTHSVALPISQAYDIGIDPQDPLRRFMGLQDNGTVRTITGGSSDWTNVNGGDGLQTEVDPTDSLYVYASSQGGNIVRSTDGGDSFQSGTNGIGNERTNWNAPVTHDPLTHQTLYTGTTMVYRTIDGAQNWSSISPDLTNGPADSGAASPGGGRFSNFEAHLADVVDGTISTIGVSPVDNAILWAGTDDGNVWVTEDTGGLWTQVNVPGRSEWVTRVTADPFDSQAAYVTFSGFRSGSRMPRIYRTVDLGATWTDISGDLPDVPLNDVVADPAWEGRLLVASDVGIYLTDSWGQQWDSMNGGMPVVVTHDLQLVDSTRTLFAGTHAISLWTFDLEQLPIPDRDLDGSNNLEDCAPDDPGAFATPGEVTGLLLSDSQTLSWDSAVPLSGADTVHDVSRGSVAELPVGSGAAETCRVSGTAGDTATDPDLPAPADGFWYLVRGRNVCGTGTWGEQSDATERVTGVCP